MANEDKKDFNAMLHKDTASGHTPDGVFFIGCLCQRMCFLVSVGFAAYPLPEAGTGITKQLKAENQLEWVQRLNYIRDRARKIV